MDKYLISYICDPMLYSFLKVFIKKCLQYYFNQINVFGTENIPPKGPTLFISNHPSSFMEGLLIACYQEQTLHFLVRGDMFEKAWLKPLLHKTNQIPIYRFRDGFEKLRNNKGTFSHSFDKLGENHSILIFPEASTQLVRYLRPLQKGAARLAIGSIEEKNMDDLIIVPCGIHYSNVIQSSSNVLLFFGPGISVRKWMEDHNMVNDKISQLTTDLETELGNVIMSIPEKTDQQIYDQLSCVLNNSNNTETEDVPFRYFSNHKNILKLLKSQEIQTRKAMQEYTSHYSNIEALEFALLRPLSEKIILFIELVLYFFIGLPGFITNVIPIGIAEQFTKNKIKNKEFIAPVKFILSVLFTLVFSIFWLIFWTSILGFVNGLIVVIGLQFSFYYFIQFKHKSKLGKYLFNLNIYQNKNRLMEKRNEVLKLFEIPL